MLDVCVKIADKRGKMLVFSQERLFRKKTKNQPESRPFSSIKAHSSIESESAKLFAGSCYLGSDSSLCVLFGGNVVGLFEDENSRQQSCCFRRGLLGI